MVPCSCPFQSEMGWRIKTCWLLRFSEYIFQAFANSGSHLHSRCNRKLLNIAKLRANIKVRKVLAHQLLLANNVAPVSHSDACEDFGMKIS